MVRYGLLYGTDVAYMCVIVNMDTLQCEYISEIKNRKFILTANNWNLLLLLEMQQQFYK